MLLDVPRSQADAILGAMLAIAAEHGAGEITATDRATIAGAATIVFGIENFDAAALEGVGPEALAAAMGSAAEAEQAVRMLAVMSLADGVADEAKTALVRRYSDALDVHDTYLDILTEVATDEIAQATACIMRKNVQSFPRLDPDRLAESAVAPFLPYADAPNPELEATYEALGTLDPDSFGRAFYDHFKRNGFAFPGARDGLAEGFTTPHDSSHVLAGYSTSQPGEICVSTFIGAMHPDHPMAAEVLPVLYSWHLGIKLNDAAGSHKGAYEPRPFWTAWARGQATAVDIVDNDWDFWSVTEQNLESLRRDYGIAPASPELRP